MVFKRYFMVTWGFLGRAVRLEGTPRARSNTEWSCSRLKPWFKQSKFLYQFHTVNIWMKFCINKVYHDLKKFSVLLIMYLWGWETWCTPGFECLHLKFECLHLKLDRESEKPYFIAALPSIHNTVFKIFP